MLTSLLVFCLIAATNAAKAVKEEAYVRLEAHSGSTRFDLKKYQLKEFQDIPQLINLNPNMITSDSNWIEFVCVRGVWIIYNEQHLNAQTKDPLSMHGIQMLTWDKDQVIESGCFYCCFHTRTQNIASIMHPYKDKNGPYSTQPVSKVDARKKDTITFFKLDRFQGLAWPFNLPSKKVVGDLPNIGSVITIGKKFNWIVDTGPGKVTRYCFKIVSNLTDPVCFITHLVDNVKIMPGTDVQNVKRDSLMKPECDQMDIVIPMDKCIDYHYGEGNGKDGETGASTYLVRRPYKFEANGPFGPPVVPGGGGGGGGNGNGTDGCEGEEILPDEHIELIGARLNGTLGSGDWFSAIKDPKQIWKTELFDKAFQVMTRICPDPVIDKEYLLLFASLYFYHMGLIWDSGRYLDDTMISEADWMEMLHDMNQCIAAINDGDYDSIATETSKEMKSYTSLEDVVKKLERRFGELKPELDHVMEINWFMANLVSTVCTKARDYTRNFLPRFLNMYHILYFSPIQDQWTTPGKYENIYKYIFGGYGMRKSLVKIGLCTYNAMTASGVTLPYKRPMDQEAVLLPKVDPGNTTPVPNKTQT